MPCLASCAATSITSPSRTQPSATRSLKKSARGFAWLMRLAWRLVRENTSTCESTEMSSASSADCRKPLRPSNFSWTAPSWSFRLTSTTTLSSGAVEYPMAGSLAEPWNMPPRCAVTGLETRTSAARRIEPRIARERGRIGALIIWRPIIDGRCPCDITREPGSAWWLFSWPWPVAPFRQVRPDRRASVCDITTSERVVAVGDVHGAYANFVAILRAAGLIDTRDRWTGGRAILIQTGDVLDRGDDSRRVLDLLRRLERDAQRAGGRVLPLLGNHELMRLLGDWRYVSAGELRAFRNADSSDLRDLVYGNIATAAKDRAAAEKMPFDERAFREQFLKEVPLGFIEMRQAFDVKGDYGPWIRARPTMAIVNGIVYLHGGISEKVAPLGCPGINAAVAKELASIPVPPERAAAFCPPPKTGRWGTAGG